MASPTPPSASDQALREMQRRIKELEAQLSATTQRSGQPDATVRPPTTARMGFSRPGPDPRSRGRGVNVNRSGASPRTQGQADFRQATRGKNAAKKSVRQEREAALRERVFAERAKKNTEVLGPRRKQREADKERRSATREFDRNLNQAIASVPKRPSAQVNPFVGRLPLAAELESIFGGLFTE